MVVTHPMVGSRKMVVMAVLEFPPPELLYLGLSQEVAEEVLVTLAMRVLVLMVELECGVGNEIRNSEQRNSNEHG